MDRSDAILRGESASQEETYRLARALKNRWKRFGKARRLLWLARSAASQITDRQTESRFLRKLCHQHALCTYKDSDLPAYKRFDRAIAILKEEDLRDEADPNAVITQETLGIAGAVFKAQWEAFGQRSHLLKSLALYSRGWQQGTQDDGYTGINAAYLLDLIAYQEESEAKRSGFVSSEAERRRKQSQEIRKKLVETLPGLAQELSHTLQTSPSPDPDRHEDNMDRLYWVLVTLGEAYLGLGLDDTERFNRAKEYLSQASHLERYDWMAESTARQLTSLTRCLRPHDDAGAIESSPEWKVLECLVGSNAPGVRNAFIGKVGLALSGGGFRASLFHIGVLARLAELDMLRHVEYLSCVSGGSIIGAYFYLELRKLCSEKTDEEIRREDYVEIVKRIEREFLAGVQENLRVQALTDFRTNLRHDIMSGALSTERVAELYEELLYARVEDAKLDAATRDGEPGVKRTRYISSLAISPLVQTPEGERRLNEKFRPKDDNWRREHKAPILILNATTLNTGHNWQFTATWMGEPPATANNEIDANQRLRRMYYSEAPHQHGVDYRRFRLGRAVGASACVPTLFIPVELPSLYDGMQTRLVDGGVHDNQGISSLLDQGCTVLLVSDASGQLADQHDPSMRVLSTALRADEIVQERVRVAQYQDLESRVRSGLLRALMFIHLKKDLEMDPKNWLDCLDPYDASDEAKPAGERGVLTTYGIHRDVQRRIAAIRTDLDAFHDTEAWVLMTSGYQMTTHHFPKGLQGAAQEVSKRTDWSFLRVLSKMRQPDEKLLKLLDHSSQRLFKVWHMVPALRKIKAVALAAIAAAVLTALGVALFWIPPVSLVTSRSLAGWLATTIAVLIGAKLLGDRAMRYLNLRGTARQVAIRAVVAILAAKLAKWHLRRFNKIYLNAGRWNE